MTTEGGGVAKTENVGEPLTTPSDPTTPSAAEEEVCVRDEKGGV